MDTKRISYPRATSAAAGAPATEARAVIPQLGAAPDAIRLDSFATGRSAGATAAVRLHQEPAWSEAEVALQTLSDELCALSAARPDVSFVAVTLGALEAADPYTYPHLLDAALKELGLTPDASSSKVDTLLDRLEQLRPDDQGLKNVASLLATALQHIPE